MHGLPLTQAQGPFVAVDVGGGGHARVDVLQETPLLARGRVVAEPRREAREVGLAGVQAQEDAGATHVRAGGHAPEGSWGRRGRGNVMGWERDGWRRARDRASQ